MHPTDVRLCVGHGRQQVRPDSGLAPATMATKDTVPVAEAGRQVPPSLGALCLHALEAPPPPVFTHSSTSEIRKRRRLPLCAGKSLGPPQR